MKTTPRKCKAANKSPAVGSSTSLHSTNSKPLSSASKDNIFVKSETPTDKSTGLWTDPTAPDTAGQWINFIGTRHAGALAFFLIDSFVFIGVVTLTGMQATQIARNITTNELTNAMRYSYLKGPDGPFHNPNDHELPLWQPSQPNGVATVQLMHNAGASNASSTEVNVVSSNGPQSHHHHHPHPHPHHHHHHHHQHALNSNTNHHGHSSNFVPLGLGLGLTSKSVAS